MAFQQAQVLKVENGFIVGVQKTELDNNGQWRPVNNQFIADSLEKAIEIIKDA